MTDAVQVAYVTGIALVAAAVVAGWRSHCKKLDHIIVLTNSTLDAANDRIKKLEATVLALVAESGHEHKPVAEELKVSGKLVKTP